MYSVRSAVNWFLVAEFTVACAVALALARFVITVFLILFLRVSVSSLTSGWCGPVCFSTSTAVLIAVTQWLIPPP